MYTRVGVSDICYRLLETRMDMEPGSLDKHKDRMKFLIDEGLMNDPEPAQNEVHAV